MAYVYEPEEFVTDIQVDPITLSGAYQTIAIVNAKQTNGLIFWLDLSVNDSTDILFRALGKKLPDGDGYSFPTEEIFTGLNKIYPRVWAVQKEEDQKLLFQVTTGMAVPYIEIQIRADSPGATPAVLNDLKVSVLGNVA